MNPSDRRGALLKLTLLGHTRIQGLIAEIRVVHDLFQTILRARTSTMVLTVPTARKMQHRTYEIRPPSLPLAHLSRPAELRLGSRDVAQEQTVVLAAGRAMSLRRTVRSEWEFRTVRR